MEFNALWMKRTALGLLWLALAMIWTATTAQAQLIIDIFPSQDNANQTIWIFRSDTYSDGPGSPPFYGGSIRGVGGTDFHRRDSWKAWNNDIYLNNKPTNVVFSLSPLLSSTNNPIDIESITTRLAGSARVTSPFYSGVTFPTNSTNAATMTFGNATKTIGGVFMNVGPNLLLGHRSDEIGIRGTSGANLLYNTNGATFAWFGAGIMDKPISDFHSSQSGIVGFEIASLGGGCQQTVFHGTKPRPNQTRNQQPCHP